MKKFFTLLGVALIGLCSAQAAVNPAEVKFEGFKKQIQLRELTPQERAQAATDFNRGSQVVKRAWETSMYHYENYIVNKGHLVDIVKFTMPETNKHAEFKDLPYWCVQFQICRWRKSEDFTKDPSTVLNVVVTWPCKANINPPLEDADVDLTPENSEIASVAELAASKSYSTEHNTFFNFMYPESQGARNFLPSHTAKGDFLGWPIWSNQGGAFSQINGKGEYQFYNDEGLEKYTYLSIDSAVDSANGNESEIEMPFEFFLEKTDDTSDRTNITGTYKGVADLFDMVRGDYTYNFSDVHIFAGGVSDIDENIDGVYLWSVPFGFNDNVTDFTPVQKYYLAACEAPGLISWGNADKGRDVPFQSDLVGIYLTAEQQKDDANWRWVTGSFWTKKDAEFYNQQFDMVQPETIEVETQFGTVPYLSINPSANTMVPGGYSELWSTDNGFAGVYAARNKYMCAPTMLAVNTVDGLIIDGIDDAKNTYVASYKGKVVYHYDVDNMSNTREIENLVGEYVPVSGVEFVDAENNFTISAANGSINVVSDNAQILVFDLSGKLVASAKGSANFNLNKGLYIVKVGKEVKKVVL
ncbi:MAG: hypothetical protein NC097_04045 [Clostridium sp.]|nr:hypothetical protein [Prevotella sp.]MCM1378118.1 hypothetical protein [Prevotella sp.]MCM1428948.1 hypothetical protein [Clostridium sp.]MCM1475982.1 hypothetical protein [Muribaculaceae bacterium]